MSIQQLNHKSVFFCIISRHYRFMGLRRQQLFFVQGIGGEGQWWRMKLLKGTWGIQPQAVPPQNQVFKGEGLRMWFNNLFQFKRNSSFRFWNMWINMGHWQSTGNMCFLISNHTFTNFNFVWLNDDILSKNSTLFL